MSTYRDRVARTTLLAQLAIAAAVGASGLQGWPCKWEVPELPAAEEAGLRGGAYLIDLGAVDRKASSAELIFSPQTGGPAVRRPARVSGCGARDLRTTEWLAPRLERRDDRSARLQFVARAERRCTITATFPAPEPRRAPDR